MPFSAFLWKKIDLCVDGARSGPYKPPFSGNAFAWRSSPFVSEIFRSKLRRWGLFFQGRKKDWKRVLTWKRAVYISRLSVGKSGALKDFKIELRLGCLTSQELEEKRRRRDSLRTWFIMFKRSRRIAFLKIEIPFYIMMGRFRATFDTWTGFSSNKRKYLCLSKSDDPYFQGSIVGIKPQPESLILAQNERWRQA